MGRTLEGWWFAPQIEITDVTVARQVFTVLAYADGTAATAITGRVVRGFAMTSANRRTQTGKLKPTKIVGGIHWPPPSVSVSVAG